VYILTKQLRTNGKGWSFNLGVGRGANKRWNMDMTFGLWNVRSLYRAGSLMTVSRELSRCSEFSVLEQVQLVIRRDYT
jgi:hypothetical protein